MNNDHQETPAETVAGLYPALSEALTGAGGGHLYLSTGCLHGKHDYCKSPRVTHQPLARRADGMVVVDNPTTMPKRPAECKFCGAPCVCPCHDVAESTARLGVSAVVRILRSPYPIPAGTIGMIVEQFPYGRSRYRVMVPGDPLELSIEARDLEVVRGVDLETWWRTPKRAAG